MTKDKDLLLKLLAMQRQPINISSQDHLLTRAIVYNVSLDKCMNIIKDYFEGNIDQDVLEELAKED